MSKVKPGFNVTIVSGALLDNQSMLEKFVHDFAHHRDRGHALVHGGGEEADKFIKKLDMPICKVNGNRITDERTLAEITMVFTALNGKLIRLLDKDAGESYHCKEYVGMPLWGAIAGSKKKPKTNGTDYGLVGRVEPEDITEDTLDTIKDGFIPVMSPITYDFGRKLWLNSKSNFIAASLAVRLSGEYDVNLRFYSSVMGVRLGRGQGELVPEINEGLFNELRRENMLTPNMVQKLEAGFYALNLGVGKVSITNTFAERGTALAR
ncbi:MAG: hypothetical protein LBH81_03705 [Rickettsiales bacterium]|nr:hypothetical protein [Rickettsiales bacterium]